MNREQQEEMAALHVLGLLGDDERAAFGQALAVDRELQALVRRLGETASVLAFAAPEQTPPPGLKSQMLAACGQTPESSEPPMPNFDPNNSDDSRGPSAASTLMRLLPWTATAALALGTTWFGLKSVSLRATNDALRTQLRLTEITLETTRAELDAHSLLAERLINDLGAQRQRPGDPDLARLRIAALTPPTAADTSDNARVIAVWDPAQQAGLLAFEHLPATADHQDYQLWIVDPAYAGPVSAGVFHVSADGGDTFAFRPARPVTQATAFILTLEKRGGVPRAEGPVVVRGGPPR